MSDITFDQTLKLYDLATNTERQQFARYQGNIAFFVGIITACVGGTVAGLFKASSSYHFLLLLVGPILVSSICLIAISATTRSYRVWLEDVTVRAKLEHDLKLTVPRGEGKWWAAEPIVPLRYILTREASASSAEFVDVGLGDRKTCHGRVIALFWSLILLAATIFGLLLYLATIPPEVDETQMALAEPSTHIQSVNHGTDEQSVKQNDKGASGSGKVSGDASSVEGLTRKSMVEVVLGIIADPRNQLVLGSFASFVLVAIVFAFLYKKSYTKNRKNFHFPQDAVYETRLEKQKSHLQQAIATNTKLLKAMEALVAAVTRHPDELQDSLTRREVELPDGIRYEIAYYEEPPEPPHQGYIDTEITVYSNAGLVHVSKTFYEEIPLEVGAFCSALEPYISRWRQDRKTLQDQIKEVESGQVLWRFLDFLYFSVLTQVTLGTNEMVPNSKKIRRLVLLQLLIASAIVVLIVNLIIF